MFGTHGPLDELIAAELVLDDVRDRYGHLMRFEYRYRAD